MSMSRPRPRHRLFLTSGSFWWHVLLTSSWAIKSTREKQRKKNGRREILVQNVGAINYNSRARKKKKNSLLWWRILDVVVDFPCLFVCSFDCLILCETFSTLLSLGPFVFNYEQLADEKFVSLQLPVFHFSVFSRHCILPHNFNLYLLWLLFILGNSPNPLLELNINWNFAAFEWALGLSPFVVGGFLINAVTVSFFAVLAPHTIVCIYIFFVASARACRIGFRIIFINLGHWQFQFLNNCFCLCLPLSFMDNGLLV